MEAWYLVAVLHFGLLSFSTSSYPLVQINKTKIIPTHTIPFLVKDSMSLVVQKSNIHSLPNFFLWQHHLLPMPATIPCIASLAFIKDFWLSLFFQNNKLTSISYWWLGYSRDTTNMQGSPLVPVIFSARSFPCSCYCSSQTIHLIDSSR